MTEHITAKFIVLPPSTSLRNLPATYVVPAFSKGHIIMIEGSARVGYATEDDGPSKESHLEAGDHMLLPAQEREVLVAWNAMKSKEEPAKFRIFYFHDQEEDDDNIIPIGN